MANIFRTASLWLKIAICCFLLGLILFVIGFATTSWMVLERRGIYSGDYGLWQSTICSRGSCGTHTYRDLNDYHRAIQAMECLGLIGFFLALLALLMYLCADSCRRRDFIQAATAFAFAGAAFASIGFAIFGSSDNHKNKALGCEIGWSMGIAIAGTVLYGIGGVMLILQLIR